MPPRRSTRKRKSTLDSDYEPSNDVAEAGERGAGASSDEELPGQFLAPHGSQGCGGCSGPLFSYSGPH